MEQRTGRRFTRGRIQGPKLEIQSEESGPGGQERRVESRETMGRHSIAETETSHWNFCRQLSTSIHLYSIRCPDSGLGQSSPTEYRAQHLSLAV